MKTKLIILSILCLAALRSWSLCPVPPSNCNFRIIEEQVEEAQSENVWEKIGWGSTTKEQCKGNLSQLKQNTPDRMRMAILNGPLTKGFVTEEHLKCLNGKTYSEETKNEILGRYAYLQSRLAENAESLMNYLAYADAFISGSKKSLDANTCKSLAQNLPNAGEKCSELVADCDRNKPTAEEQNQYFENMANGYINSDCKKNTNLNQDEKARCQSSFPWAYGAEYNRVLGRGEKPAQAIQRQIQLNASLMKERLQKVMQLAECTNTGKSRGKACEIDDVDELIDALPIPSDDKVPVDLFKNEKNEEKRQNLRMNIANRDYNNCLGERGKDRKKSTHDWNLAVFSMATAPINGVSVLAVRGATALAQSARLMNSVRAIRVTNMARRIPIGTVADDALLFKQAHKSCSKDNGELMLKPEAQRPEQARNSKMGVCQLRTIASGIGGADYQAQYNDFECGVDVLAAAVIGGTYTAKPVMGAVRKILGKPEASQAIAKGPGLISRTVGAVAAPVASIGKAAAKGAVKVTTPVITAVTKSEMVVQLKSSPLFQKTASFLKDKAEKVKLRVEKFKSNEVARKNFDAYGDAENTDAALKALKVLKSKEEKGLAESVVDARELIAKINDSKDSGLITKTLAEKILEKPLKPETMEWIIQQRKAGQIGSQIPAELRDVEVDYLRMLGLLP